MLGFSSIKSINFRTSSDQIKHYISYHKVHFKRKKGRNLHWISAFITSIYFSFNSKAFAESSRTLFNKAVSSIND